MVTQAVTKTNENNNMDFDHFFIVIIPLINDCHYTLSGLMYSESFGDFLSFAAGGFAAVVVGIQ